MQGFLFAFLTDTYPGIMHPIFTKGMISPTLTSVAPDLKFDFRVQESDNIISDLFQVRFKREMSTVNELDFRIRDVFLESFGTSWDEDRVVLSPDGEYGWFMFAEVFLEIGVEGFVGLVIVEDIELIDALGEFRYYVREMRITLTWTSALPSRAIRAASK
jgi:hypothetical protein